MSSSVSAYGYSRAEWYRRYYIQQIMNNRQSLALIQLAASAVDLYNNYKKQKDSQKRQLKILEDQQVRRRMYWTLEEKLLREYGDDGTEIPPSYLLTPDEYGQIFAGRLWAPVARKFEEQLKSIKCNAGKYTTSYTRQVVADVMKARAIAMANSRIRGRWLGYLEYSAKDDMYFGRRVDIMALGAGLLSVAADAAASATAGFQPLVSNALSGMLQAASDFRTAAYSVPSGMEAVSFHSNLQSILGVQNPVANGYTDLDQAAAQNATGVVTATTTSGSDPGLYDPALGQVKQMTPDNNADWVAPGDMLPATGSMGRQMLGTTPPMVSDTSMWQDRARTAKVTHRWTLTVIDTYTGGGRGWVDVDLAPYDLRYVDDQAIGISESGKQV